MESNLTRQDNIKEMKKLLKFFSKESDRLGFTIIANSVMKDLFKRFQKLERENINLKKQRDEWKGKVAK